MARLVVLEFPDNEDAEAFVYGIDAGAIGPGPAGVQVAAVYARPTKFCTCTTGFGMKQKQGKMAGGFTRTRKYGWWVHAVCGKPTQMWTENFQMNLINAKDLLPGLRETNAREDADKEGQEHRSGDDKG